MITQTTFLAPENFMFKHSGATPTLQLYPSDTTDSFGIGKNDKDEAVIIDDDKYLTFNYNSLGFD